MGTDDLIGKSLSSSELQRLLAEGRIVFPFKPTTTSAVSQPADKTDKDTFPEDVDTLIDSVKDNEDIVKMLEDMRDDMLAGMKIPPANSTIANAAVKLGSPDGTINKNIWDTAVTIINTVSQNQTNNDPVIGAITGNGGLTGDFLNCNEVTKAIADNWKLSSDAEEEVTPDELHAKNTKRSVTEARESFSKKMKQMAKYIFRMLWWNLIWARLVMFFLETTEKLLAVPIDTPFLIFRFFKRLTKDNYMTFGPIHRLLNKLKILLLCKVPRSSSFGPDYEPDEEIRVWYPTGKKSKNGKWMTLKELCSQVVPADECPENTTPWPDATDQAQENWPKEDAESMQTSIANKVSEAFPEGTVSCIPTEFLDRIFVEEKLDGPGMSPNCIEAAKTILEAVQDDALHYGEYEGMRLEPKRALQDILEGKIKDVERPFEELSDDRRGVKTATEDEFTDRVHEVMGETAIMRTAQLTGTGDEWNTAYYDLDSITVDGIEEQAVLPTATTAKLVDATLTVNGVEYELNSWIDEEGTESTVTSTQDGYSVSYDTSGSFIKIQWNNNTSTTNDGFNITDNDSITYKYWTE